MLRVALITFSYEYVWDMVGHSRFTSFPAKARVKSFVFMCFAFMCIVFLLFAFLCIVIMFFVFRLFCDSCVLFSCLWCFVLFLFYSGSRIISYGVSVLRLS